eukprot:jgi/Picre1/28975/NNA_004369.t1
MDERIGLVVENPSGHTRLVASEENTGRPAALDESQSKASDNGTLYVGRAAETPLRNSNASRKRSGPSWTFSFKDYERTTTRITARYTDKGGENMRQLDTALEKTHDTFCTYDANGGSSHGDEALKQSIHSYDVNAKNSVNIMREDPRCCQKSMNPRLKG